MRIASSRSNSSSNEGTAYTYATIRTTASYSSRKATSHISSLTSSVEARAAMAKFRSAMLRRSLHSPARRHASNPFSDYVLQRRATKSARRLFAAECEDDHALVVRFVRMAKQHLKAAALRRDLLEPLASICDLSAPILRQAMVGRSSSPRWRCVRISLPRDRSTAHRHSSPRCASESRGARTSRGCAQRCGACRPTTHPTRMRR